MARPTAEKSAATKTLGKTPEFGVFNSWGQSELYPAVNTAELLRDMRVMAETDETVGAMLWCIYSIVGEIDWTYVPQVDGVDAPEDEEAKKYSDLATSMLYDMDQPFSDHIEDALTMIVSGFAPVEIVMKQRNGSDSRFNDNFYGIRSLNLLDQTTIWDWKYNGTQLSELVQMGAPDTGKIPLFKVLHYRTTSQYNNPRGRPLLKNAHRIWKLKKRAQDSEAIGIERDLCGLPIFEMPESEIDAQFEVDKQTGEPTEEAKRAIAMVTAAKKAVSDMRFNKSGGLVHASDTFYDDVNGDSTKKYAFRIQTTGGQRAIDVRTTVRDYDHAMARVAMMQFLTLGQRSGGSYGLSEDQSSMAVNSIVSLATKIVREWNQKTVPLVWTVNAWPDKYRPRLRHSEVNKNGIVQLGQFLGGLAKAENFWGNDPDMRMALAKAGNLPYDPAAQREAATTHQKTADMNSVAPKVAAPAAPGAPKPKQED